MRRSPTPGWLGTVLLAVVLGALACLPTGWANRVAQPQVSDFQTVTWMEEAVLAVPHPDEELGERLTRLERAVFGQAYQALSPQKRIAQLDTVLLKQNPPPATSPIRSSASNKATTQGIQPANAPGLEADQSVVQPHKANASATKSVQSQPQAKAQPLEEYPAVSAMESRVFGEPHPEIPLETRLNNLETRVMGRPQQGPLYARVDQLRMLVLGDTGNGANPILVSGQGSGVQSIPGIPPHQGVSAGVGTAPVGTIPVVPATGTMASALSQLEQTVLRQTFPYEPETQRLDRLEMAVFNRTSPPDVSNPDRLERLDAVVAADKEPPLSDTFPATAPPSSPAQNIIPLIIMGILMFL